MAFDRVLQAIDDIKNGKMVVMVDDKKYVKDILSASNELDRAIKNGKTKTFKNAKEMFQDIGVKVG